MGLYNFRPRFALPIVQGLVRQTIRNPRQRQDKPGDTMHLYTGLRRPSPVLLLRAPCVKVQTVTVWSDGEVWLADGAPGHGGLSDYGWSALAESGLERGFRELEYAECDVFARADGFTDWKTMLRYYDRRKLPFYGGVWHWDFARRVRLASDQEDLFVRAVVELVLGG